MCMCRSRCSGPSAGSSPCTGQPSCCSDGGGGLSLSLGTERCMDRLPGQPAPSSLGVPHPKPEACRENITLRDSLLTCALAPKGLQILGSPPAPQRSRCRDLACGGTGHWSQDPDSYVTPERESTKMLVLSRGCWGVSSRPLPGRLV